MITSCIQIYNIKIDKLNNIQMAYIGLEPKSSHTIKVSQPLELVLFHIIPIRIKYLKCFYNPQLLNNYLINYLIFSGLTKCLTGLDSHIQCNIANTCIKTIRYHQGSCNNFTHNLICKIPSIVSFQLFL